MKLGKFLAGFLVLSSVLCAQNVPLDQESLLVSVSFSSAELLVMAPDGEEIGRFKAVVPKKRHSYWPVRGRITRVVINPSWGPTPNIRKAYFNREGKELAEYIKPGDEQNAMGAIKVYLDFSEAGVWLPLRIHGTNQPEYFDEDKTPEDRQASAGCIRLRNDVGLIALALLTPLSKEEIAKIAESGIETSIAFFPTDVVLVVGDQKETKETSVLGVE